MLTAKIMAFVKKEILTSLSYRYSFYTGILFAFIAMLFYFMMADVFKAAVIPDKIPYGGDYLAFIVTGAVLWQVVNLGLHSISITFMTEMFTGTLETIYLSRTNILLVLLGVGVFSLLINIIVAVVSIIIAVAVFGIQMHFDNLPFAVVVLVLTYLSMLGFGMLFAGITIITKSIGQLVSIFTLLLSFLCGVLFPVALLPEPLRRLSDLCPLSYALDALRATLLTGAGPMEVAPSLTSLIVLSVILIPLGYKVFFICLERAKAQGSLAQY